MLRRPLGSDARCAAIGARHGRGRAARRVLHPRRPGAGIEAAVERLVRRRRTRAALSATRSADAASPGPRANADVGLEQLRAQAAAATGREAPEIVPLRRVRLKDVLTTVAVGFAAYLLITQLTEVGFGTIADALREASVPWVVLELLLAQLTFVTSAISLRGAVLTRLPLLPCVGLASAVKFINLTVPSSAGRIAFTVRFLQKTGAPPGEAIAAGAVDKLSETILELVLVLSLLPFVDLQIDTSGIGGAVPSSRVVGVIVLVLVAIVVLVLLVPALREKVVPSLRDGLSSLWAVANDRGKRIELFGRQPRDRGALRARTRGGLSRVRGEPAVDPAAGDQHGRQFALEPRSCARRGRSRGSGPDGRPGRGGR